MRCLPWNCLLLNLLLVSAVVAEEFPAFKPQVLDPKVGKVCYAVTAADVNADGKIDAVAVTENRVLWFENPSWQSHVILENQTTLDNVCIAPLDIDGDGLVDFALGAGWTKVGTLQWLSRGKTPESKWEVHFIGEELWTHRMRFADVLGSGKPQLVVSPLNKSTADGVRLTAFSIPKNPKTDRWPRTVLDESLNRMHNHWHVDFDGNGSTDTLTASEEGVWLIQGRGEHFTKMRLGTGMPGESPATSGAGEIKLGQLSKTQPFITTVEPMHGTSVVVYTPPAKEGELWQRQVLDATLGRGHALWVGDVDHDGAEEIVLGHSDPGSGEIKGPGIYIYDLQADGKTWKKQIIDNGGMATEDLILEDFNGDGWLDILAGGRASQNVKLYWNQGGGR